MPRMIAGDEKGTSAPLSLRANFSWLFVANLVYAACNWATLVALAKLGTPEIVGRFAFGLAITSPIILFSNLQLRQIQATDAQRQYAFRDYLGLRLVMLLLALVIVAGVVLTSPYDFELALVIVLVGVDKAADAVSDVIYGLLQQHEQMDRISGSLILKAILSLLLLTLGQYLTHSLVWAVLGWCLGSLAVTLFYDTRSARRLLQGLMSSDDGLQPRFDIHRLSRLAWLALPLGITMLLISLNANIPRYFVAHYSGDKGLGVFAALAALATAGTTMTSALGQSAAPRLAKYYAVANSRAFRMLLLKLMLIGALLGAAGVLVALVAGRPILSLAYQPEYATQNDVLVWLMVGGGVSYLASFCGYGATAARRFSLQPVVFSVCVASAIGLCALLVPRYGALGAAWALLLAYALQLMLMAAYLAPALGALHVRRVDA
jgi:O-antigen/teichoic acid export membrane protein